jgi:PAS domain S-box-containing protein
MNWFKKNSQDKSVSGSTTRFWPQVVGLVFVAIAYWVAVRLGLLVVAQPEGVASIWPASGFALAILLLNPKPQWPKLLAVIFITNALGNLTGSNSLLVSLGFALANTLEPLLGAWALTYIYRSKITFGRIQEIFALFGVAFLSNGLTALLGAAVPALASGAPFMRSWLVWWTSDGMGMILVTPLIVTWATSRNMFQSASPRRLVEAVLLVLVLVTFAWLLFGKFTVAEEPVLRNYMLFPLLIWLGFRFSPRGMASALTLVAAIAIWNTLQGYGIFGFSDQTVTGHLVSVQMLLSVAAFSGLLLSAVVAERKQAGGALRDTNELLSSFIRNSPIYAFIKDVTPTGSRVLTASENYRDMIGIPGSKMVGKTMDELFPAESAAKFTADDQAVVAKGVVLKLDEEMNGRSYTSIKFPIVQRDKTLLAGYTIDITERKQAEDALQQSEEKFSKAFQTSPYAIAITRAEDGKFIEINGAFTSITGFSPEDILAGTSVGLKLWVHEEDRQHLVADLRAGRSVVGKEYLFRKKNGEIITGLFSAQMIQLSHGPCILSSIDDITERKSSEKTLRESEFHYRELADSITDVFFEMDQDLHYTYWNKASETLTGVKEQEAIGKSLNELFPDNPEIRKAAGIYLEVIRTQQSQIFENTYQIGDKRCTLEISAYPSARGISVFSKDITDRKRAGEVLHENEQRLASIYNTVGDVIFYLAVEPDEQFRFSSVNPAFYSVTGMSPGQVIGRKVKDVIPEPSLNLVLGKYRQAIEEKTIVRWEETSEYPAGRLVGEVNIAPVFDEQGNCTNLVGSVHDVTGRVQAEEQIHQLNASLEQRVEERTRELRDAQEKLVRHEKLAVLGQLAGGVGHELRNPLSVINNAVYYLKLVQPDADDKIRQHHAMIEQEVHNAEKIISDLLDFARIKSVDRQPVSVPELVQRVLSRFPVSEHVTAALKLPPGLPMVFADPRQMEQVLGNLTVNACQAMPEGGKLTISARREKELVVIAVKDTGVGIPPENMKRLFEPLFTTKAKGIGLGLALSRKLAEANSGRIEVQSDVGKGSTFTLYLPVSS